jgi:hypothetical protein
VSEDTLRLAIEALLDAARLINPPPGRDETIGAAMSRAPKGHPVHEIAARTVKCEDCGGLLPLYRIAWLAGEDGLEACCPYCSETQLRMWKPPVAGHA